LVVDDEPDIVALFSMLLERRGFACESAATGARALELVESWRPTVMLLDIGLPDLDGYAIAQRVRAAHGQAIFLAAVTGWGKREDKERAYRAGFDIHVTKPIDELKLLDILLRASSRD
jgi:CheY-like chemotaxis protein